jgi:hypothetical protein
MSESKIIETTQYLSFILDNEQFAVDKIKHRIHQRDGEMQ